MCSTRRILIVDESEYFIQLVARKCFAGDEVRSCSDGFGALAMLKDFRPDLLLMSLSLPFLDGLSVLRQAAYLPETVLVVSNMTDPQTLRMVYALGVDHVLCLPTPSTVLRALDRASDTTPGIRKDLRSSILEHLHRLGIPTDLDGYQMLTVGLPLYLKDPGQTLGKELYPAIACAMDRGSSQTVERSIRQAIHAAWKRRDERIWGMYFPPGPNGTIPCPNNKKFLTALLAHLQEKV